MAGETYSWQAQHVQDVSPGGAGSEDPQDYGPAEKAVLQFQRLGFGQQLTHSVSAVRDLHITYEGLFLFPVPVSTACVSACLQGSLVASASLSFIFLSCTWVSSYLPH